MRGSEAHLVTPAIVAASRFISSGGDSSKVAAAKNTIIYALVGLVLVALAQVIVHFVLAKSNTIASGNTTTNTTNTTGGGAPAAPAKTKPTN